MPEMTPPAGGAPPGQPQQPPFGANPAMGATPNKGFEAAGLQKLGVLVKEMESLIPLLGVGSEPGKAVYEAIGKLMKHVPQGSVSPASQKHTIQDMMMKAQQNGSMQKQLDQSRMQPPGGGGGPSAPPAGAPA